MDVPKFKVCIIGPANVGKSSLLVRIQTGDFKSDTSPTTSVAVFPIPRETASCQKIIINFWDTAGHERYKSMGPLYYQQASACIGVFAVNEPNTFLGMQEYIHTYQEISETEHPIVVILANKCDLNYSTEIVEKASEWAEENHYAFFQTSALDGKGILEFLAFLTEELSPPPLSKDEIVCELINVQTVDVDPNESKCC